MTSIAYFKVNGKSVASGQFQEKTDKALCRVTSRWISETEFAIRGTLQATGIQEAVITIGNDNVIIEHVWVSSVGTNYGTMKEGKVIG